MYKRKISIFLTALIAAILLGACKGEAQTAVDESNLPAQPAGRIVQGFYDDYLGYPGNPLVSRAYQQSRFLAQDFVEELDALLDKGIMYDPVLCAQDRPDNITAQPATVDGQTATVEVGTSFGTTIQVELGVFDKEWKITAIKCQE